MSEIIEKGKLAKKASYSLATKSTEEKNEALIKIAEAIVEDKRDIIEANKKDLEAGREAGLDESVLDRIMLDGSRIEAMADGIRLLTELKDPIGGTLEKRTLDNGLQLARVRVPIGVIGMIYEARRSEERRGGKECRGGQVRMA